MRSNPGYLLETFLLYIFQEFEINAKSEMLSRFVNRVLEHNYSHLKQYILAIE